MDFKLEIFSKGRNDILLCGNCRGDSYQTADSGCFGSGKAGGCAKMHFKGDHGGTADPFSWRIVSGSYGIEEPEKAAEIIEPEEISLALVPCLTCSEDGRRLGYGGGFYDRFLRSVPGPWAVLCRGRLMEAEIPWEAHDLLMDVVIWEEGILELK